ncbi:MAG: MBL fold metallo-hydrolase [Desulfuromonas sp.]|nr:MAG: MBL fold metallo-hydrolase [Desulfuromonas sp.]
MSAKSLKLSTISFIALLTLAGNAFAADEVTIATTEVADQIFMLTGQGGNIGLFTGPDGTFLIDDQYAPLTDKIVAAIKQAGGDWPKFLINTHYHGDHTGGNENLGGKGTLIFAHDNVREQLLSGSYLAAFDKSSPPAPQSALPVVTFAEEITFHLNGDTVHADHVAHAHTDGDSIIHFKQANVIHAGDVFFNGFYPFIDVDHGGTLRGIIIAADKILALADDQTKIIPGHGPLGDKAELSRYRDMLWTAYTLLKALKIAGKTVEEAVEMKPLADLEAEWGDGLFKGDNWIAIIYPGVY